MVSLVEDNMSKEYVVKFSSENGNSSRVKYKRRDVSAVRDLPLGCAIIRSRNRYTPRKVSATRDYPLYCGANAPLPTEEDRARIKSSSKDIAGYKMHRSSVSLPTYGPNDLNYDMRNRVRDALRLFRATCQEILQGEEASRSRNGEQSKLKGKSVRRIDLTAAKIVKEKGKEVNTDKQILGAVPGVEVGDEFQYRVELAIVGIHRLYQAGIDYMRYRDNDIVAVSIVASGGYDDELDSSDVLIYSGQGGLSGKDKEPEDQKLERGNLALKNSIAKKNPVRVIRGSKETQAYESADARVKKAMTYVYDGLYIVERYWQEEGPHGKLVYKFLLRRMPGQPELVYK